MELKTWQDLEKLSIGQPWAEQKKPLLITGEPLLRTALMAVEMGHVSKEQALIQLVFALVDLKNSQQETILNYLNRSPFRAFVMPEPRQPLE